MAPQGYATFSAIFAVVGIGHLLTAANRWTGARRHAAHYTAPEISAPFATRRARMTFHFLLSAGVFYALAGIWLGWRASSG
ncbi:hypothetical protein [Streptomyces violascens]|uniref:hypothetical protein n=1 Tax=Streptomyces violascens TaxID=67381 RepID=UPI00167A26F3|nr:hypothetical protein [Streptomyces violascens]GGU37886.1 hypothetical protein GCM10010289_68540 [Streptomyces violascens]